VSKLIGPSACLEPLLLMLEDGSLEPALSRRKGRALISLGDCTAEVSPMDGRAVLTSVTVPSASEPRMPLLLLLAAEYASGSGRELFVPGDAGCGGALDGIDACAVREGVCAGRPGSLVVYMGPRLLRRRRRRGRGA
jgi:hypothetical protein